MLDKIMLTKPVSFHMREHDEGKEFRFIAQDVESIYPELVCTANDANKTKSLNYIGLIAPSMKAVQELKADNDNLRMQLKAANDNTRRLEGRIERLEERRAC